MQSSRHESWSSLRPRRGFSAASPERTTGCSGDRNGGTRFCESVYPGHLASVPKSKIGITCMNLFPVANFSSRLAWHAGFRSYCGVCSGFLLSNNDKRNQATQRPLDPLMRLSVGHRLSLLSPGLRQSASAAAPHLTASRQSGGLPDATSPAPIIWRPLHADAYGQNPNFERCLYLPKGDPKLLRHQQERHGS